jgi:hypothetical protein
LGYIVTSKSIWLNRKILQREGRRKRERESRNACTQRKLDTGRRWPPERYREVRGKRTLLTPGSWTFSL